MLHGIRPPREGEQLIREYAWPAEKIKKNHHSRIDVLVDADQVGLRSVSSLVEYLHFAFPKGDDPKPLKLDTRVIMIQRQPCPHRTIRRIPTTIPVIPATETATYTENYGSGIIIVSAGTQKRERTAADASRRSGTATIDPRGLVGGGGGGRGGVLLE